MDSLIIPKCLTKEVAEKAVAMALELVFGSPLTVLMECRQCHIVVLVPGMERSDCPLQPAWTYEKTLGDPRDFEHDFVKIAQRKAIQFWTNGNSDRTFGDTPPWGGVKRSGVIVICSGLEPWFGKMLSGIIADIIVALSHAYVNDTEKDE